MRSAEDLSAALRAAGGKLTPQRLFLFRALEGNTSHPTAEELFERVRAELPTLSLGTVYKTLAELVDLNELRPVEVGDGRTRFDPNTAPHAHQLCRECGRLEDVPIDPFPMTFPMEQDGFLVVSRLVTFEGYCPTCRAKRAARETTDPFVDAIAQM